MKPRLSFARRPIHIGAISGDLWTAHDRRLDPANTPADQEDMTRRPPRPTGRPHTFRPTSRRTSDQSVAFYTRQAYPVPMPTKLPKSDLIRLNVNLNPETATALHDIADTRGISFTEAIRRCISVYTYIAAAGVAGHRVSIIDATAGTERELVLL